MAHRIFRKVVNLDPFADGRKIICAWSDCDRDAYELHKVRTHNHLRTISCDSSLAEHITYAFCSERHRQLWGYSNNPRLRAPGPPAPGERMEGRLPMGSRGIIG